MSVYKIVIGKDMAPENKNTSHMGVFFCFSCVSTKYLYFKVIGDNIYP